VLPEFSQMPTITNPKPKTSAPFSCELPNWLELAENIHRKSGSDSPVRCHIRRFSQTRFVPALWRFLLEEWIWCALANKIPNHGCSPVRTCRSAYRFWNRFFPSELISLLSAIGRHISSADLIIGITGRRYIQTNFRVINRDVSSKSSTQRLRFPRR